MHLYRTRGLNARIAYNAMSGYAGYQRQLEDTRNAVGFLGDDMFSYLGPGEDMMPDDPDYPDFTRHRGGQATQRGDPRRGARPIAGRLRGRQRRVPDSQAEVAHRAPEQRAALGRPARPRERAWVSVGR